MAYSGRTRFGSSTQRMVWLCLPTLGFLAVALFFARLNGPSWELLTASGLCLLGAAALLEAFFASVVLAPTELSICRNFRRSVISRLDITQVSREVGCPTLLLLRDGSSVELPDLGVNDMYKSLRAWLKAT